MSRSFGILLGFALFWCGLTGVFLGFVVLGVARHLDAQRRFHETEGTVVSSEVHRSHGSKGPTYKPKISTRYSVRGKEYVTERHTFDDSTSSSAGEFSRRIVDAHPAGKRVTVYYDPKQPEAAILDLSIPTRLWFTLLFLQPFLTIGAGMVWGLFAHFPAKRRLQRFLAEPSSFPWDVPTWGRMTCTDFEVSIEHRPSPTLFMGAAYGVTSFLTIFLVGLTGVVFYEGFFESPGWTIVAGFAVAIGAAVLLGSRMAAKKRRSLTVDRKARTLTVGARTLSFDHLRELRIERPTRLKDGERDDPRLSALLRDGEAVPLHTFDTPWKADEVALKTASLLADALRTTVKTDR